MTCPLQHQQPLPWRDGFKSVSPFLEASQEAFPPCQVKSTRQTSISPACGTCSRFRRFCQNQRPISVLINARDMSIPRKRPSQHRRFSILALISPVHIGLCRQHEHCSPIGIVKPLSDIVELQEAVFELLDAQHSIIGFSWEQGRVPLRTPLSPFPSF